MRPAALQAAVYLTVAACMPRARRSCGDRARSAAHDRRQSAGGGLEGSARRILLRGPHVALFMRRAARQGARHAHRSRGAAGSQRRRDRLPRLRSDVRRTPWGFGSRSIFPRPRCPTAGARPLREGDLAAVDARFQSFRIESDAFRNMGIGDCELVQQFAQQLLSKLTVRDVHQDIVCVPYQPSASRFLVRGEILKPLPPEEQRALRPGTGR